MDKDMRDCLYEIKQFLDYEFGKSPLFNQLECLKNFNFNWLKKESYSKYSVYPFDEDNTRLARLICFVVFKDKLPYLNSFDDIGTDKIYRGETINNFNPLFESDMLGIQNILPYEEVNKDFYFHVLKFRKKFLTIGNFMLLPNIKHNGTSLNTQKGLGGYFDYADLFFQDLYKDGKLNTEGSLKELIILNENYLPKTFDKFCENNYLNAYIENGKPKEVFTNNEAKYHYWQKADPQKYKDFALEYMNKSTSIIDGRAECMISELNKFFSLF